MSSSLTSVDGLPTAFSASASAMLILYHVPWVPRYLLDHVSSYDCLESLVAVRSYQEFGCIKDVNWFVNHLSDLPHRT